MSGVPLLTYVRHRVGCICYPLHFTSSLGVMTTLARFTAAVSPALQSTPFTALAAIAANPDYVGLWRVGTRL